MKKKSMIKLLIGLCTASLVLGISACSSCSEENGVSGPIASAPNRVVTEAYLSDKSISLLTGETHTLAVGNATAKEWKTSNSAIATVNNGVVEAKGQGLAFITVTGEQGEKLTCMVNVSDTLGVPHIAISAQKRTVGIADVFTLSATASVDGVELTEAVTWSVSDNTVAEITENGNVLTVRALKAGTAQIGATLNGASALFELTVRAEVAAEGTFTETPETMTNAPITQTSYYTGASVDSVQTGESSVVYSTSYYGKYTNNAQAETQSLVLFGTLTGENRTFEWKNTGRFAYGFMLETLYTKDVTQSTYVDKDMVYYATEGADANGNYGVVISDLPEGYYGAYAFVEYEQGGQIIREVSKERTLAGNFDPQFVSHTSDIYCTTLLDRWSFVVTNGVKTPIELGDRTTYTDSYQKSQKIYYTAKLEATSRMPSVKFKVTTPLSKNTLQELANSGRTLFRFYVCYRAVDFEGKAVNYTGDIYTVDTSLLDKTCVPNAAKINNRMACDEVVSIAQIDQWTKIYTKRMVKAPIQSNRWYMVQYDVNKLIEFYDVLFDPNSQWALCALGINGLPKENVQHEMYISNFTFEAEPQPAMPDDLTDVLPNLNDWAVMLGGYNLGYDSSIDYTPEFTSNDVPLKNTGTEDAPTWIVDIKNSPGYLFKTSQVQLEGHVEEDLTYKDKEVAFSFSMPANNNRLPIYIGAGLSQINKDVLQELLDLGYTKLSFSFVHAYGTAIVAGGGYWLLDLEKVKNNPDMKLRVEETTTVNNQNISVGRLNLAAFKEYPQANYNNDNGAAKEWVDVEYSIADLLACYDQLFAGEEYWTLAIPYGIVGNYKYNSEWDERDVSRCYVSKMSFEK